MRKLLKPFVLWLLLSAVPFQGYAAATMMCCGSAHPEGVGHTAMMQSGGHSHWSSLDRDDDDDEGAVGLTSNTDSDSGAHHHANHHSGDDSKRLAFKCGTCASCCVGAAIMQSSDHSFGIEPLNATRISFLARYFYRFVPETLERPPYSLVV